MVEQLISVVIIAIVIQTVVENLKKLIKFPSGYYKKILNLKVLLTMIVSLIICVSPLSTSHRSIRYSSGSSPRPYHPTSLSRSRRL